MTTTARLVGTTVRIGRREFTVADQTDSVYGTMYVLTGPRGAQYGTMRNKNNPGMMFLVNMRGFGIPAGYERTWLTDKHGVLEVVR